MPYQHDDEHEHDRHEAFEQDWICIRCEELLSPDRPPVLNLVNCSCAQAGAPINDPNPATHVHALTMNMNDLHITNQAPNLYPMSDDSSVKTPDGPEARDPANAHLPLTFAADVGEPLARRRATVDEVENQMTYSINRFLKTGPPHERSLHGSLDNGKGTWISQPIYIVGPSDSARATGRGSGSGSGLMSSSHSTGSSGPRSTCTDLVKGSGAWMTASQTLRDDWPMEIDDDAIDDDEFMGLSSYPKTH